MRAVSGHRPRPAPGPARSAPSRRAGAGVRRQEPPGRQDPRMHEPTLRTSWGAPASPTHAEGSRRQGARGGQEKTEAGAAMWRSRAKDTRDPEGQKDPPLERPARPQVELDFRLPERP